MYCRCAATHATTVTIVLPVVSWMCCHPCHCCDHGAALSCHSHAAASATTATAVLPIVSQLHFCTCCCSDHGAACCVTCTPPPIVLQGAAAHHVTIMLMGVVLSPLGHRDGAATCHAIVCCRTVTCSRVLVGWSRIEEMRLTFKTQGFHTREPAQIVVICEIS